MPKKLPPRSGRAVQLFVGPWFLLGAVVYSEVCLLTSGRLSLPLGLWAVARINRNSAFIWLGIVAVRYGLSLWCLILS